MTLRAYIPGFTRLHPFEPDGTDEVALDLDALCFLLSSQRRRWTIALLDEGAWPLDELTDEIASLEAGPNPTSRERKTVYVSLYQVHAPRLHEHGVVEFDAGGLNRLEPGPNHEAVLDVLADLQDRVADDGGVSE